MADSAGISFVSNGVDKLIKKLTDRSNKIDAGLARDVTTMFSNAQRKRWMTEGGSEGKTWDRLNPTYEKYKRTRYAGFPGGGRKLLIATGQLVAASTGVDTKYFARLIDKNRITFVIKVPYAKYVNEHRDFIKFSPATRKKIVKRLAEWYFHGK